MKKTFVCRLALAMVVIMCFAAVSAVAADFAPSIEAAPVPEVVAPSEDKAGVGAVITGADNNTEDVALADMLIVSYNDAKTQLDNHACEKFVDAYDALKKDGVKATVANIDAFVAENLNVENPTYFVSNVFELNLGEHSAKLEGDATVTVRFDNATIKAKSGELVVAHMVGDTWKIVANNDVKVTDDVIEVTFDELCPVAFINVAAGEAPQTPDTPDTGDDKGDDGVLTATIIILSVTAVIIAGIVVFYVLEKKGVLAKLSKKQ